MSTFEVKMVKVTIEPHDNADALEVAHIDGTEYTSVVPKGKFATGDEALYIPDQAIVPDWILEELNLVGKLAGSKRNRVKPMNLRGVLSQGILYKPSDVAWDHFNRYTWPEIENGELTWESEGGSYLNPERCLDWAPALGIEKWIPEVPLDMAGEQYAPDRIMPYTEIDDIKKYPLIIEQGEEVVITEKIHGTCAIYHLMYGTLHVSSKGIAKKGLAIEENENNLYWKVADSLRIKDKLVLLGLSNVTLFGEIYGVQDLKYGKTKGEPGFRAFDIAIDGEFVNYGKFIELCSLIGIPTVPTLYIGPFFYNHLEDFATGPDLVTLYDTRVENIPVDYKNVPYSNIREGVVIKPTHERRDLRHGRVIFKYISPDYLNRKGDTTEYE